MQIEVPKEYSAAQNNPLFRVTGMDAQSVAQVKIYVDQLIKGVKRFGDMESFEVNVAPYIATKPMPSRENPLEIVSHNRKAAKVMIAVNDIYSQSVNILTGEIDGTPNTLLSLQNWRKTIAWSGFEEIFFLCDTPNPSAKLILKTDTEQHTIEVESSAQEGICRLAIEMKSIQEQIDEDILSKIKTMEVCIDSSSRAIKQIYDIVPATAQGVTLCWINPFGVLDYYTFPKVVETHIEDRKRTITIVSPYERIETLEYILSINSAEGVWMLLSDGFKEVKISKTKHLLINSDPNRITLNIEV